MTATSGDAASRLSSAPELLRLNINDAIIAYQMVAGRQQTLFIILWQARGPNVKAQMNR